MAKKKEEPKFKVMYQTSSGHCYWIDVKGDKAMIAIALLGSNENIRLKSILEDKTN